MWFCFVFCFFSLFDFLKDKNKKQQENTCEVVF